ncbi:urea carboxylase [Streptomyces sp. NPDC101151]|uniref:urea carboxylase n=1 Tax=Streptomyces sp. NPDC101151 TaxID=3366115 RepID=UPI00380207D0
MFGTLLIANRGEIACRIIAGAQAHGLRTVAVYSDADRSAPHVRMADHAVRLGPPPASQSYLSIPRILQAAADFDADAVHPGYGFLAEDHRFAAAVEAAGMSFVGPSPSHLKVFGDKRVARQAAERAGVPVIPASPLINSDEQALRSAESLGYPLMIKAARGGGGIGMRRCDDPRDLPAMLRHVERQAEAGFGGGGIFLEHLVTRARHVEVQVFGDGAGGVSLLGTRDCSLQRRQQKVLEEAPAPLLSDAIRSQLHSWARRLCQGLAYRSAGTIEFIYDLDTEQAWFLEGNPRLQVEHPVTEMVTGLDLVSWMLRLAGGERGLLSDLGPGPPPNLCHAVEARLYAEDPSHNFLPSSGLLTLVQLPADVRVDTGVETGQEITSDYDPLLAKIIASGADRRQAFDALYQALQRTRIDGVETNLGLLREACRSQEVLEGRVTTTTLSRIKDGRPRIEVVRAGTSTTVQDWPGRTGYWHVGVPPSGPMDSLSFCTGNLALGNAEGAPGLECTWEGPILHFTTETVVCVTGAPARVTVDGRPAPQWEPLSVGPGALLEVAAPDSTGMRTYVLVQGGVNVPDYLGSAATFPLGRFGGHAGRPLRAGDVLRPGHSAGRLDSSRSTQPAGPPPVFTHDWDLAVYEGPHSAPDFITREGMQEIYATPWEVHAHSARSGVRLIGPRPLWARRHAHEAGLHPSNIHDTPYSVGAVNFSGDTPIILGPDGPSLGGYVCPMTVATADRWKIGQMRPGDTVRFRPVPAPDARPLLQPHRGTTSRRSSARKSNAEAVMARGETADGTSVVYRRGAEDNLLVEYGSTALDLGLRLRAHALHEHLIAMRPRGLIDITPGTCSLHLHVDPDTLSLETLLGAVMEAEELLPPTSEITVPSREVHLPLSWDDPAVREAISRYSATVRARSPWTPSNIDFIRRTNGLTSPEDVRNLVLDAQYLVLGLGDVYLGAPCATAIDPRHRLATAKYSPARTWTPEAAVGLGGPYLCVYGMESPGGYQLIGRTVPIWSSLRQPPSFEPDTPWLLRVFDRLIWHPVSSAELRDVRADLDTGHVSLDIRDGVFDMAWYQQFLSDHAHSISAAQHRRTAALLSERNSWDESDTTSEAEPAAAVAHEQIPDGEGVITAPLTGTVWQIHAGHGTPVTASQPLLSLEVMKLEVMVRAPCNGVVDRVMARPGQQVGAGTPLMTLDAGEGG